MGTDLVKTTNALGKGTRNLTANVPNSLYVDVGRLANVSGCGLGEYVRALLEEAVNQAILVRDNPEDRLAWEQAVSDGATPLPKVRKEIYRSNVDGAFIQGDHVVLLQAKAYPDPARQQTQRSVKPPPSAGDEARVTKTASPRSCIPKHLVVQPPPAHASTTGRSGASPSFVNEDPQPPTTPGPKARSTRGIKKAARSGQAGAK